MKHYIQSGIVIVAGFLGAAAATGYADHDPATDRKPDVRESVLRKFLQEASSPVESYAATFIAEADSHHLDWRLLPSLAIVESGAGQRERRNNIFGWANGASRFSSVTEAIHHVAEALAESRPYRGKDLRGKLAAYNPTPGYLRVVTGVMRRISPVAVAESY
jgi:hypothetical protein